MKGEANATDKHAKKILLAMADPIYYLSEE